MTLSWIVIKYMSGFCFFPENLVFWALFSFLIHVSIIKTAFKLPWQCFSGKNVTLKTFFSLYHHSQRSVPTL